MRLVPWAKDRSGARIALEIDAKLLSVAERSKGDDHIVVRGSLPPTFDVHCEMMSLPMALGLKLDDLPGAVPYLSADATRLERWHRRLADLPRPLVALAWAGRPTHLNDANRSLKLSDLQPLGQTGATLLSIQKGAAAAQVDSPSAASLSVLSLSAEIDDFEDTAAILCIADLLISVDFSPVHLAGALGRPAWVMLPKIPDWRWLLDRADSPWYPHTRLFCQERKGDWSSVISQIASELSGFKTG
jgi:hypothetical protein